MRAWDAFSGLDSTVKNTMTSLRAVSELQNPAIRERHWQELMQATQVGLEKKKLECGSYQKSFENVKINMKMVFNI